VALCYIHRSAARESAHELTSTSWGFLPKISTPVEKIVEIPAFPGQPFAPERLLAGISPWRKGLRPCPLGVGGDVSV